MTLRCLVVAVVVLAAGCTDDDDAGPAALACDNGGDRIAVGQTSAPSEKGGPFGCFEIAWDQSRTTSDDKVVELRLPVEVCGSTQPRAVESATAVVVHVLSVDLAGTHSCRSLSNRPQWLRVTLSSDLAGREVQHAPVP